MAVEFTIVCDDCGSIINASGSSVRAARAEAQLQCGAYCGGGVDRCQTCRVSGGAAPAGDALKGAPSVGTQRDRPAIPGPDASWPIDPAKR